MRKRKKSTKLLNPKGGIREMKISPRKAAIIVIALVASLTVGLLSGSLLETNKAGFIQVKQAAVTGNLTCKLNSGTYFQNFGDIHTYEEASTFYFTADTETGEKRDQSLQTQFNDGAKARISGSVRVLLPNSDCDSMLKIHRKFKSMNGVVNRLVLPAMRKAMFASGPHMTAAESYAERRNEFASLVEDQLLHGVIDTEKEPTVVKDLITGTEKTVFALKRVKCGEQNPTCVNGFVREQKSVFYEFNISLTNFVIDDVVYPTQVLDQIERQRKARMDIITQEAEAKQAEARAKKAKAEAEAAIEETRAKEEIQKTQRIVKAEADKAEAVLQAEKTKEVAKLEKDAAEFEKKKQILLGEGEATRKRLVMQADGALEKKLQAWIKAQEFYASALGKAQPGALVPSLQMGGSSGSSAQNFIDLFTAKAAKDLSLDMRVKGTTTK